jgi:hypothetical protein
MKSLFNESGIHVILGAWILLLDDRLGWLTGFTERRIHQHDVESFMADVHKCEASHGIF